MTPNDCVNECCQEKYSKKISFTFSLFSGMVQKQVLIESCKISYSVLHN